MDKKLKNSNHYQSFPNESKLIDFIASLFFSVPTAALIWIGVNKELAFWGGFLSSTYLIASIIIFALLALFLPSLFPSILGGVWRAIMKISFWT